ncbi:MAG: hypothetical protein AAF823_02475 [Planctomycetota bacterium]
MSSGLSLLSDGDDAGPGFFRIEHRNGRHTLITPNGQPFFALGVNHVAGALNRDARRGDAVMSSNEQIVDAAEANLRRWGFNTVGYDAPEPLRQRLPYFSGLQFTSCLHALPPDRFGYDDVFCLDFQSRVEEIIVEVAARRHDDPLLIAYYTSDTPRWDLDTARLRRGIDWVSHLRSLPADRPGKRAYVAFLDERYANLDDFVAAYRTPIDRFDDLLERDFRCLELTHPRIRDDDEAFLALIAETHYAQLRRCFDRHDPNHLVFSERYKMHDHPDEVIAAAGQHFDAIAVQPGPEVGPMAGNGSHESVWDAAYWTRLTELSGRPTIVCDHQVSFYAPHTPATLWHQAGSQEEAGAAYTRFAQAAAESPNILGYQRCQYASYYDPTRRLTKQGLIDDHHRPHATLVDCVARANAAAVEAAASGVRG